MSVASALRRPVVAALATLAALAIGCGGTDEGVALPEPAAAPEATDADSIREITREGPVEATVSLSPKQPVLGDNLVLTLEVRAEAGVTVELPAFGEALGRFSIVDFAPRRQVDPDGAVVVSQRYTLQPPMSGRQRVPPLRIEFLDDREGQVPDGEEPKLRELLTEELRVQIASVVPEGELTDQLRGARGELEERLPTTLERSVPWAIALLVVAGAAVAVVYGRRAAAERRRVSAFDRAMARMRKLEAGGLPGPEAVDGWYVELSSIIRHYLEDRYRVRAPELTTEEFLREAKRSAELTASHRDILSGFLERCDRVKFAGYLPQEAESQDALQAARRFLDETRLERDGSDDSPAAAPPSSGEASAA